MEVPGWMALGSLDFGMEQAVMRGSLYPMVSRQRSLPGLHRPCRWPFPSPAGRMVKHTERVETQKSRVEASWSSGVGPDLGVGGHSCRPDGVWGLVEEARSNCERSMNERDRDGSREWRQPC